MQAKGHDAPVRAALGLVATSLTLAVSCLSAPSSSSSGAAGQGGAASGSNGGAGSSSSSSGSGGAGGAAPPGPAPKCAVPTVDSSATSIVVTPSPLTTADAPSIEVTDTATAYTNVTVRLCTPSGPLDAAFQAVDSGQAPYAWRWTAPALPRGKSEIVFAADPGGKIYRTAFVDVGPAGSDAGSDAPFDAGGDLCSAPPGNLLQHGTFEEGMDALAPHLWQVRNPSQPGACMGSGTPAEHVFLAPSAPGCGGNAVAIDARGQWDCYAIQMFTDYNTIEGGATYRIGATMRSQGNAVNPSAYFHLGAQWLDGNDVVFGDLKNAKPATPAENDYDWRVFSYDIVAPANARRVVVWLSGHYPGRVDYDDVSVVKVP